MQQLSEQELLRREKLQRLKSLGIAAYPAENWDISHQSEEVLQHFSAEKAEEFSSVKMAGRVMGIRLMGKAAFIVVQDEKGRMQWYISRDGICPGEDKTLYDEVFKHLIDIGDIVGGEGHVFVTRTGETTLHVTGFKLLSKSLRPLPIVKEKDGELYDAFTDPDQRYRQRYVDLIVNPGVRETFVKRSMMVQAMRQFMASRGYLEVETPVLQPIYGGALARPFKTHHNTLDMTLYLRIANELYLKRLITGGYQGVFEFAKDFRNEGMSRFHNPEFTMLELYVAYKDCYWMMDFVEEMMEHTVLSMHGTTRIRVGENEIDFARPWKRYTMYEAIKVYTGYDISGMGEDELRQVCRSLGISTDASMGRGKLIDEIFGNKAEPQLIQPTFITDYPVEMSPLAKRHRDNPDLVERFEVICNAKEIANAFSELNDPIDQRERFEEQLRLGKRGDTEAMVLDEDFLRALEYGMPPTAGIGIGIDRLAMVLTNQASIQEVIFFPQMRPEKQAQENNETNENEV